MCGRTRESGMGDMWGDQGCGELGMGWGNQGCDVWGEPGMWGIRNGPGEPGM